MRASTPFQIDGAWLTQPSPEFGELPRILGIRSTRYLASKPYHHQIPLPALGSRDTFTDSLSLSICKKPNTPPHQGHSATLPLHQHDTSSLGSKTPEPATSPRSQPHDPPPWSAISGCGTAYRDYCFTNIVLDTDGVVLVLQTPAHGSWMPSELGVGKGRCVIKQRGGGGGWMGWQD